MRYGKLLVSLLITALLLGCGSAETVEPATTETIPETVKPATTETIPETKPVTVYAGAVEHYLNPVQKYSDPRQQKPEFVMLHFTSAVMLSKEDPYNMQAIRDTFRDYEVSIHYIVDRDGVVYCYIPEDRKAWHAGTGTWADPKYTDCMNTYSIGIEVMAIGSASDMAQYLSPSEYAEIDPTFIGYTEEQYIALKQLVTDICQRYGIPMDRQHIIGHEEYAPQKTDPGELFDWNRIIKEQG